MMVKSNMLETKKKQDLEFEDGQKNFSELKFEVNKERTTTLENTSVNENTDQMEYNH